MLASQEPLPPSVAARGSLATISGSSLGKGFLHTAQNRFRGGGGVSSAQGLSRQGPETSPGYQAEGRGQGEAGTDTDQAPSLGSAISFYPQPGSNYPQFPDEAN